jgi:RHS repeat-associated protein
MKRLCATENDVTTIYFSVGSKVLYEKKPDGGAAFIYGPMGEIAKRTTLNNESHTFYYHTDRTGSTRLVTDEDKNIVSSYTYHPFGETGIEEGSEDYLFTGKERDGTGLYYFGARYYDPDLGRFITRDPSGGYIKAPQTLNRYAYCLNNPLKFIDPDGRDPIFCDKEKNPGKAWRWSQNVDLIDYVDVDNNYDDPLIGWFWIILAAIPVAMWAVGELAGLGLYGFLSGVVTALGEWLNLHPHTADLIIAIIGAIIGAIIAAMIASHQEKKLSENDTVLLAAAVADYMVKAGIDPKGGYGVVYNSDDDTYTVTFGDGSTQTFKKVGNDFVPIPTPSDPPPTSNDPSSSSSGGSGTGDYAPREPNQYY